MRPQTFTVLGFGVNPEFSFTGIHRGHGEKELAKGLEISVGGGSYNLTMGLANQDARVHLVAVTARQLILNVPWFLEETCTRAGATVECIVAKDRYSVAATANYLGPHPRHVLSFKEAAKDWPYPHVEEILAARPHTIRVANGCRADEFAAVEHFFTHNANSSLRVLGINPWLVSDSVDPALFPRYFQNVEIVMMNDREFMDLRGRLDDDLAGPDHIPTEEFAAEFLASPALRVVVVTCADRGVAAFWRDAYGIRRATRTAIPPIPSLVDATGAGDAFMVGFLAALARGCQYDACAHYGIATASLAIGRLGGANMPYLEEVESLVAQTMSRSA